MGPGSAAGGTHWGRQWPVTGGEVVRKAERWDARWGKVSSLVNTVSG